MASFQRLVLFFLLLASFSAFADYRPAPEYRTFNTLGDFHNLGSAQAACSQAMPYVNLGFPYTILESCQQFDYVTDEVTSSHVDIRGTYNRPNNPFQALQADIGWYGQFCAPNTRKSGSVPNVICNGTDPSGPPPCVAGQNVSSGTYANGSSPLTPFPNVVCADGCTATFSGVWPDTRSCANDVCTYYARGSFDKNGQTCSGGGSLPPPVLSVPMSPEQAALKALEEQRQAQFDAAIAAKRAEDAAFNAALKAAAGSSAADATAKKLAADAAAADKALKAADAKSAAAKAAEDESVRVSVMNNPDSTQAQKDAATAAAAASAGASNAASNAASNSASDAATKAAAAASAAGQAAADAKAADQKKPEQLCDSYPNAPACLVHTADAGFCVAGKLAGFKCEGDAISCAATKAQQESFCASLQTDGLSDFGSSLINQQKTFESDIGSFDKPSQIEVGQLNSSSFLPKACLTDMNFAIAGQNIVLPLSKLCDGLQIAGRIVKFFAYMIAAKIIFS